MLFTFFQDTYLIFQHNSKLPIEDDKDLHKPAETDELKPTIYISIFILKYLNIFIVLVIIPVSFEDLCELPDFEDPCENGGSCSHDANSEFLSCK